jgi:phosphopantetheine adenylyltransferase/dephospho-CoA kinase
MEDGTIDRRKLGPIVFSSKAKMDALNTIVWPVIAKLFQEEVDRLVKT